MFVAVERLLIKLRQPASRADELVELRRRVRAEIASDVDEEERLLAHAVQAKKLDVAAELGTVSSCGSCARHFPWPIGGYAGGACCSGVTADLFDDNELAALAQTGTRTRDLVPPRDIHAGCAFRGSRGCSLEVAHRPARCVRYLCETLRGELHDRGQLETIEGKLAELNHAMQGFAVAHQGRLDREVAAPLIEAIADAVAARTGHPGSSLPRR
jgi:hypothetical protein